MNTLAGFEAAVHWAQPWLAPWRDIGSAVQQRIASGAGVAAALDAACAGPVRFVPQAALPTGMAYESFIAERGQVPTRDSLHDFFNGLVWWRFPQAKVQLNRLQAGAIAAAGVGSVRGPLRDAITVFDENGAVLAAPDVLWQALLARDWQALFVTHRARWAEARLLLFGHALLEKLVAPRKAVVAHVLCRPLAMADMAHADDWLAQQLQADALAAKPFTPLPVLGVPGWWPANAQPGFYDDAQVFRCAPGLSGPRAGF
ncbi:DUF3025 domain-containing protein [Xylophilus sp. GW821-FHT01B05]